MINDTFEFVNEVHELTIDNGCTLGGDHTSIRISLIIGLMKHTTLTSISWTLSILERRQKTNFSFLTAIHMNKQTELLWAPALVLY